MSALLLWLLACAHGGPAGPPRDEAPPVRSTPDCCTCQMWGVTGQEPEGDWAPPPMPEACHKVLEDPECAEYMCPVPM